jgi:ribonucleoside-triphosphate reductase
MELSNKVLSDITVFNKYAKYLDKLNRRETWDEICSRYEGMMIDKYPALKETTIEMVQLVREKKILPSMRAMQFAGPAITKNNSRIYNCAFMPIDDYRAFSETMFLLLGGTGVGYSVQFHHVEKLPEIIKPTKERKFLIGDSIEGWADAVKVLMKSYLGYTNFKPRFDYTDIRQKGSRLITAGGKAPGPEPLKLCLAHIEAILESKQNGEKLTPLECHDILCYIANAVLAGGIRRAAMIALFSFDDEEMLTCKYGNYWERNEQRGRANNSAVIVRNRITEEEFQSLWKKVELSGTGEPGIYFTNNAEWGTNPCAEIALRPFQFCNLCDVNVSDVESQEDLNKRVAAASYLGTLQAGFTDFHYLRDIWKKTTEKDALVGIGNTGIASGKILKLDLKEAAKISKDTNQKYAEIIGINKAARVTTIKPSGTTSCVLGTSSGVHAWHNDYYVRRLRIGKNEALYTYLVINHPELIEDEYFRPQTQAIINIPQKAPEGSIVRSESALDLLERVKRFNIEWIKEGHRSGDNTNNVSATVSIKPDIEYVHGTPITEWDLVGDWMWENKDTFNGLSVLPYDNGSYIQAPFEDITKEKYEEMMKSLKDIDLTKVVELDDDTTLAQEAACFGGSCEIPN